MNIHKNAPLTPKGREVLVRLELVAGATNIILLGLNMRDGLKMKGRFRPRQRDRSNSAMGVKPML